MVLSPQAQRAWKLGTAVLTSITTFHVIFRVDYGDHDHVFTGLQRWYNRKVDEVLIGDSSSATNRSTSSGSSSNTKFDNNNGIDVSSSKD